MMNRLLSTRFTELQIERILRAETIAALLSAEVDRTIRNALSRRRPDVIADILRRLPQKLILIADTAFLRFARWSRREAAAVFATTLPRKWFREVVPAAVLVGEEVTDGDPDFLFVDDAIGPVVGRLDDDEWQQWVQDNVWPSPTADHVRRIIDTTTAGITWQKRIENLSRLVQPEVTAQRLSEGFSRGLNVDQLAREILPHVNGNVRASAKRIARTEGLRIANTMQTEMFEDLGDLMVGQQIVATLDEHTRPHHALRNGRIHYSDRRRRPNMDTMPVLPDEPNCVLPGNVVEGRFCGASRAFYSGQTIEFRTAQGRTVSVTPNHPVLTLRGFLPAKDVRLADQLVCNHGRTPLPIVMSDNHKNPPTLIEKVFSTLADSGQAFRVDASSEQFHGDGELIEGDVDIVRADSQLRSDLESTSTEDVDQFSFGGAVMESSSLPSLGSLTLPVEAVDVATSSCVRCSKSGGPISSGNLAPLEFLSFGTAAILGTVFEQQTNEPERLAFTVPQSTPGYTEFFRQLIDRLSSVVAIDDITDIQVGEFKGHVYDLQSDCEMYSAGGIIVHNCRCFPVPVMRTPDEIKDDPQLAAEFQNADGNAIPDPNSYSQWFANASQDRKELAVGKRRYREMRDKLGRTPEWADFVDEQGKLIPRSRLKAESDNDRTVRRRAVDLLIQQRQQMLQDIKSAGFEFPDRKKRKQAKKSSKATQKTARTKKRGTKRGFKSREISYRELRQDVSTLGFIEASERIREWVAAHGRKLPAATYHGMAKPEEMRSVTIQGVEFLVPAAAMNEFVGSMTSLARSDVLLRVWQANDRIVFTKQRNKDDPKWRKKYKNFTRSAATGGDGTIVVYDGTLISTTLTHESGHNLAKKIWGSTHPQWGDYATAQKTEKAVTEYGENSPAEDFAEAVKLYSQDRESFKKRFPKKFKALAKLIGDTILESVRWLWRHHG